MSAATVTYEAMSRLSEDAADEIRGAGLTLAEYIDALQPGDGATWHGDTCGCSDDRCVGFHHGERERCGCLPVLIDQARPVVEAARGDRRARGVALLNQAFTVLSGIVDERDLSDLASVIGYIERDDD